MPDNQDEKKLESIFEMMHRSSDIASISSLDAAIKDLQDSKLNLDEIAGAAHVLTMDFPTAYESFKKAKSQRAADIKDLALWYGRHPQLVKQTRPPEEYKTFLEQKALWCLSLVREGQKHYIEGEAIDFVQAEFSRLGLDYKQTAKQTANSLLDANRNVIHPLFLAHESADAQTISRAIETYRLKPDRTAIEHAMQRYAVQQNYDSITLIQDGDSDKFFPTASHVFKAVKDGQTTIIKEYLKLYLDHSSVNGYCEEKAILERISHPNIVPLKRSFEHEGHQLLEFNFINEKQLLAPVSKNTACSVVHKLCDALQYLHDNNILYMDVKKKNILYGNNLTLLDFGMARTMYENKTIKSLHSTPRYLPPEMARHFTATTASDVFQTGILLYELLTGEHPFINNTFREGDEYRESELVVYGLANQYNAIRSHEILTANPKLESIVHQMVSIHPSKRPTIREVQHALEAAA